MSFVKLPESLIIVACIQIHYLLYWSFTRLNYTLLQCLATGEMTPSCSLSAFFKLKFQTFTGLSYARPTIAQLEVFFISDYL